MNVKILGSGAWEGIPVPFCKCRVCESAKDSTTKNNRTRPEILIETEEGSFLIEISPDIRNQSSRFNLLNIKNYLISHWHFDHMYGLYELHAWADLVLNDKMNLFCSEETTKWLNSNFGHIPKEIHSIEPFKKFKLKGVNITPFPVYHMKSRDQDTKVKDLNNTFGFCIQENSKKVAYLADYYDIPGESIEIIKNADIIIADGTYLFEELFPDKHLQNTIKGDPDHMHGENILTFVKTLTSKKVIFHSISHLTEKNHEELQKMLPDNMYISYDGMEIKL